MELNPSLKVVLKRLRLSGIAYTLPDRIAYAKSGKLTHQDFLELVLQDEIDRRERNNLKVRLEKARFQEEHALENFDWNAKVTFDRDRVKELFGLGFLEENEDIVFMGPVGVGKTFLASALGHAACRMGKKVLFLRAEKMLKELNQSRADNSTEKAMRKLLVPDLLIIDDFGLRQLDHTNSSDLYEVIVERHKRSSTMITSNRTVDEWIPLFDDPALAQSCLDRFAHNAHQVVMEGESYRQCQGPAAKYAKSKRIRKGDKK
jgi:DNA replication protein DnaC